MINHQVVLSLGNWPQQSVPSNYKLSPTTERILIEVNLEPISLLPLSFLQFTKQNNLTNTFETSAQDLYNQEIKRRKQKIQIIKIMWAKMKIKRSKSTRHTFKTNPSSQPKRSIQKMQRNSSKSSQAKNFKKKQKSPLIFQVNSPKQSSTYFDYYSTNNRKKIQNKKTEQEQSTKSRRQRTGNKKIQQYLIIKSKKKDRKSTSINKKILIQDVLKRWSQIDQKHQRQLKQARNIMEHEKKRLIKIHQIQKQKLRKQIENLQTKNSQSKKLRNNFTQY